MVRQALMQAARDALAAPSIYNTQPWRWNVTAEGLELWADLDRHLKVTDADGRQLMISCGCALHHAVVALAASGWQPVVRRLPDPGRRHLAADINVMPLAAPAAQDIAMYGAMRQRHTDRRAFTAEPVPARVLSGLAAAAERQGAHLYFVTTSQLGALREAAQVAEVAHQADPAYRAELAAWAHRPPQAGDGIAPGTAVDPSMRRVPVRVFGPLGFGRSAGLEHDAGASYGIVFTDTDERVDCIRAGEALSAVLLTAVSSGLATAPVSDVIEVPRSRRLLQGLLAGGGYPQIAVRIGYSPKEEISGVAPRRDPDSVITSS
ncbi:Acg family FMN-binding oxidoreductase [Catelliglobosispora koreensis]|uniref:Acg family FMN-binding oxidoreductase n=1 Tax=Catelliglobosispora koreensis TaxID=129052 RepID=UPI00035FAB1C|nr:nitroreductase family protein [Catelliglobosispora koreensis]